MSNLTSIKTLCTNCLGPMTCEWPNEMNWQGQTVSAIEYMAYALNSEDSQILCDQCLDNYDIFDQENMEVEFI